MVHASLRRPRPEVVELAQGRQQHCPRQVKDEKHQLMLDQLYCCTRLLAARSVRPADAESVTQHFVAKALHLNGMMRKKHAPGEDEHQQYPEHDVATHA